MTAKTTPRPGGRSARVQAAVHQAVHELDTEIDRAELTVPLIADRAGVTPSTIYRRWGTLADVLSDVALGSLRAETAPVDTGTVLGDLQAWAEQYLDEMTSTVGLTMLHDVLAGNRADVSSQCSLIVAGQIRQIVARGLARQEAVPEVDAFMDAVVAPIIFRALFGPAPQTRAQVRTLVERCVAHC
ncbi:MAG: TetR/AcrR family transcriptional regulator [Pseudomonadota bacterium]|nr:TetR/AcrR family transcriptional regulator [Pseudomonadota bacterium]